MPNDQNRLEYLYQRFISDEASPDEVREFWLLMGQTDENHPIKESVFGFYNHAVPPEIQAKEWKGAAEQIFHQPAHIKEMPRRRIAGKWWVAAAVAIAFGAFGYFYFTGRHKPSRITGSAQQPVNTHDVVPPSTNRATITLADGKTIYLDNSGNGLLATQNNVELTKTGDGTIAYTNGSAKAGNEILYNTLTNSTGSRAINITLSDGSRLWLNAGSSSTFPVTFNGRERKLTITGEAYFEVAHDPARKFTVLANGLATEVLGTYFNVNAYGDKDAVKVTLLRGSVKVTASNGSSSIIKPGEQVVQTMDGKLKTPREVDVDEVVAWKNEMFRFNNTDIKDLMKEVSRWYDVEIEYKGDFHDLSFGGNMSRQKNVSELLKRLEATQAVKFEVNGRKITVMQTK